jgi:hypothetical protein
MYETLFAYFERSFVLTDTDKTLIKSVLVPKKLNKGEFMQREGEIARSGAFVAKGFLRSYVTDDKGKEHIVQFAPENWWVADKSLMAEAKASFSIDAIEDSDILLIGPRPPDTSRNRLCQILPAGIQKRATAKMQDCNSLRLLQKSGTMIFF